MGEQLQYLQPKLFTVTHNNFTYEVVVCHEYYADATESENPGDALDFTGNYLITMLTPNGTIQTVIDRSGEEPFESDEPFDVELYRKIIAAIPS